MMITQQRIVRDIHELRAKNRGLAIVIYLGHAEIVELKGNKGPIQPTSDGYHFLGYKVIQVKGLSYYALGIAPKEYRLTIGEVHGA